MDKLTVISGTLFMAADVFAIVSLAMPDWIITDVGGKKLHILRKLLQNNLVRIHIQLEINWNENLPVKEND